MRHLIACCALVMLAACPPPASKNANSGDAHQAPAAVPAETPKADPAPAAANPNSAAMPHKDAPVGPTVTQHK